MEKATYQTMVTVNMYRNHLHPGDMLTMNLRSEHDGIYQLAVRLKNMFLQTFSFFPESIAIHPDHLAILKKQGKSLDITISEEIAPIVGAIVELADIPRVVPLIADDSLDLFTAIARFEVKEEGADERATEALRYALKNFGGL